MPIAHDFGLDLLNFAADSSHFFWDFANFASVTFYSRLYLAMFTPVARYFQNVPAIFPTSLSFSLRPFNFWESRCHLLNVAIFDLSIF